MSPLPWWEGIKGRGQHSDSSPPPCPSPIKGEGIFIVKVLKGHSISWEKGVQYSRVQGFKCLFSNDFIRDLRLGNVFVAL